VVAVDGLPDMSVPVYDRQHLAGNHVMLACGDVHIAMAHFRQGSVRVKTGDAVQVGQLLAEVGNSGGSNEPHLHIHAQRPGPHGAPMGGEPLPMSFDGRFLVRGERIDLPGAAP
jgi:murein DD-endopeptidase MepM/ murein hydrolase activator NlpD